MDITLMKLMMEYKTLIDRYTALKEKDLDIRQRRESGELSAKLCEDMMYVMFEIQALNAAVEDHKKRLDSYLLAKQNINNISDSMTGKAN